MRLAALAATLLFALTACAPMTTGPATPPTVDVAACAANGGTVKPVCRMQKPACIFTFDDAGKSCTDSDQCKGRCIAADGAMPSDGAAVAGVCEADNDICGCSTEIIGGKAQAGRCVD
ncbi:MAG: hypothetical protein V4466_13715 [Pseudomonadota bacterium]